MLTISQFRSEFLGHTKDWDWEVEGFIDTKGHVHPIDIDTKVISTVFERLSSPVIRTIAAHHGYVVETSNQTTYPDFSLSKYKETGAIESRIATDIKTTYHSANMTFTLGGYRSFLRNNTKNIFYPYDTYTDHWIIGFVYERRPAFAEYDLNKMPKRGEIPCPYRVLTVFVREKHAIAGLRAGSGNTSNIGSIRLSDPKLFATQDGPFMAFRNPKEACEKYWRSYEKYVAEIANHTDLVNHPDFSEKND